MQAQTALDRWPIAIVGKPDEANTMRHVVMTAMGSGMN